MKIQNGKNKNINSNGGYTLLVAIVVTSFLLIVSFSLANIALKQILISSANQQSQYAFYNADSGVECALYWDLKFADSYFATSTPNTIRCNDQDVFTDSQDIHTENPPTIRSLVGGGGDANPTSIFEISYPKGCAIVTVHKEIVLGLVQTTISSKGYNTCDVTSPRRFERGIELTY